MLNNWFDAMKRVIEEVEKWLEKTVQVFHHNDADGITSGAILTRAFDRQGYKAGRFCLEKPYPAVLRKVYEQQGQLIIFANFAGRIILGRVLRIGYNASYMCFPTAVLPRSLRCLLLSSFC